MEREWGFEGAWRRGPGLEMDVAPDVRVEGVKRE